MRLEDRSTRFEEQAGKGRSSRGEQPSIDLSAAVRKGGRNRRLPLGNSKGEPALVLVLSAALEAPFNFVAYSPELFARNNILPYAQARINPD